MSIKKLELPESDEKRAKTERTRSEPGSGWNILDRTGLGQQKYPEPNRIQTGQTDADTVTNSPDGQKVRRTRAAEMDTVANTVADNRARRSRGRSRRRNTPATTRTATVMVGKVRWHDGEASGGVGGGRPHSGRPEFASEAARPTAMATADPPIGAAVSGIQGVDRFVSSRGFFWRSNHGRRWLTGTGIWSERLRRPWSFSDLGGLADGQRGSSGGRGWYRSILCCPGYRLVAVVRPEARWRGGGGARNSRSCHCSQKSGELPIKIPASSGHDTAHTSTQIEGGCETNLTVKTAPGTEVGVVRSSPPKIRPSNG